MRYSKAFLALISLFLLCISLVESHAGARSPGGRLTLQQGRPVMNSDQVAKSTIYYTCFASPAVPIPNGLAFEDYDLPGCEISTGLSATVATTGHLYDLWIVKVGATPTLCYSGEQWSVGSRAGNVVTHGAITLHNMLGYWSNVTPIANCYSGASGSADLGVIPSNTALYVGTFRATADGQTSMAFQPLAVHGGTANKCVLFNAYNRVPIACINKDTGTLINGEAAWDAAGNGARVPCNSSAPGGGLNNRIYYTDGLGDLIVEAELLFSIVAADPSQPFASTIGFGLNDNSVSTSRRARLQDQNAGPAQSNLGLSQSSLLSPLPGGPVADTTWTRIGMNHIQCIEGGINARYYAGDFAGFIVRMWN